MSLMSDRRVSVAAADRKAAMRALSAAHLTPDRPDRLVGGGRPVNLADASSGPSISRVRGIAGIATWCYLPIACAVATRILGGAKFGHSRNDTPPDFAIRFGLSPSGERQDPTKCTANYMPGHQDCYLQASGSPVRGPKRKLDRSLVMSGIDRNSSRSDGVKHALQPVKNPTKLGQRNTARSPQGQISQRTHVSRQLPPVLHATEPAGSSVSERHYAVARRQSGAVCLEHDSMIRPIERKTPDVRSAPVQLHPVAALAFRFRPAAVSRCDSPSLGTEETGGASP